MAPIPDYPGIKPTNISTYNLDFGDGRVGPYESVPLPTPSIKIPTLGNRPVKKMKDKALRAEIRGAVNDYLTNLIAERSRPGQGHGMAVSAQDLMVASRGAGHRGVHIQIKPVPASRAEADKILERFTKPPVIIIKPSTASTTTKSVGAASRARSVPAAGEAVTGQKDGRVGKKEKKDYHWLVWKTTPTPVAPSTPGAVSAPPPAMTPAPPVTPAPRTASRARSVISRLDTPAAAPYTPGPQDPASPDPFRTPTGVPVAYMDHLTRELTPAPPTPAPNPNRVQTPMSLQADHHNNMASPQMYPKSTTTNNNNDVSNTKFVPALNAWVAGASDQEKDVAFNFLKALNAGMNPLKIPKVKARAKPRAASAAGSLPKAPPGGPTQLYRMPAAGVRTSAPANKAYLDKSIEQQYIKLVAKSLQTTEPSEYQYTGQATTNRPWPTHLARAPPAIDYTHEASFFQSTRAFPRCDFVIRPDWRSEFLQRPHTTSYGGRNQFSYSAPARQNSMPTYRSHFIIHPEWVSETQAGQRNLKLLDCTKGPKGIRYMAQRT